MFPAPSEAFLIHLRQGAYPSGFRQAKPSHADAAVPPSPRTFGRIASTGLRAAEMSGPRAAWKAIARAIVARRDTAYLKGLPDYLLRDIGLTRWDVERAVVGPAYRGHFEEGR